MITKQTLKQTNELRLNLKRIELMQMVQMPAQQLKIYLDNAVIENPYLEITHPENNNQELNSENATIDNAEDFDQKANDLDQNYEPLYTLDDQGEVVEPNEDNTLSNLAPKYDTNEFSIIRQIQQLSLNSREQELINFIIGNLENDGYLTIPLSTLANDIAIQLGLEVEPIELQKMIEIIQSLDPPGVGAKDLPECLLLQLQRLPNKNNITILAERLIRDFFNEISNHNYPEIIEKLNITSVELEEALSVIKHLKYQPLDNFLSYEQNSITIVPDFFVYSDSNELYVELHSSNGYGLKINEDSFKNLKNQLKQNLSNRQKQAKLFLNHYYKQGKILIHLLEMRQETLLQTMKAIVFLQKDFFLSGDFNLLKAMKLKDIQEKTGYDLSTISRVINSKYVQTDMGIFSLKIFLNTKIENSFSATSKLQLSQIIKDIIANENKQAPLSDEQITAALINKGFNLKRRSVTNYRKELNIPVSSKRREL